MRNHFIFHSFSNYQKPYIMTEEQVSIVLLKYSMEDIENAIVAHVKPGLCEADKQSRRQIEKTLEAVRKARSVDADVNAVKEECARLSASLLEYRRECRELADSEKTTNEDLIELERFIEQENISADLETKKYLAEMEEIIEKFRQTADVYDKEKMKRKTIGATKVLSELLPEKERLQNELDELRNTLENLKPDVPENILENVGKTELEKKLQYLQKLHAKLRNEKN